MIRPLFLSLASLFCLALSQCSSWDTLNSPYKISGTGVPENCSQAIVGIPLNWNSSSVQLVVIEKNEHGTWQPVTPVWDARLGKSGSIWGLGISPVPHGGQIKSEGDKRTPTGIFNLDNTIYAYNNDVALGNGYSLKKITPQDLWVDDPKSPDYNRHLVMNHPPVTEWEKKQQMEQIAPSHKIKLFIHHNSPIDDNRPLAGSGSSIFFHIWRNDGASPTAGCTSMSEENLRTMLSRLDASKNPVYIIIPQKEYVRYKTEWNLP